MFSLWRKARRENSAASRLLGSTSLRFALHGWQRACLRPRDRFWVSRPAESHRQPLAEPYVTLSRHTAPIIRPFACPL
ncbi:hypothetical protein, partial [Thiolapillus sp.]|uniref:hypothetical protein n=1 Tax=Thiolapillus sp. TaxID=2017437 RepID=UPI003AF76F43